MTGGLSGVGWLESWPGKALEWRTIGPLPQSCLPNRSANAVHTTWTDVLRYLALERQYWYCKLHKLFNGLVRPITLRRDPLWALHFRSVQVSWLTYKVLQFLGFTEELNSEHRDALDYQYGRLCKVLF